MHGDKSAMFRDYVNGREKVIFPWSLSIVDCFFVRGAFARLANSEVVTLSRVSAGGTHAEEVRIADAYDLYDIDTDANGLEVLLLHEASGSACYWDVHERFVVAVGPSAFLDSARPFPRDIEKHRYLEAMFHLGEVDKDESAEVIYEALSAVPWNDDSQLF